MAEGNDNLKEELKVLQQTLKAAKELNLSKEAKLNLQMAIQDLLISSKEAEIALGVAHRRNTDEAQAALKSLAKQRQKNDKNYQKILKNRAKAEAEAEAKAKKREEEKKLRHEEEKDRKTEVLDIIGSFGQRYQDNFISKVIKSKVTFDEIAKKIKETYNFKALGNMGMAAVADATKIAVLAGLQAQSALAGVSGQGAEYSAAMHAAAERNTEFGVTIGESGEAIGALLTSMSTFSMMAQGPARQATIDAATQLKRLGISAETSGFMMEYSQRVLGKTGKQAAKSAQDMANFASSIGVAPAKMAAEFQAAAPRLASYGKKAEAVFKSLAIKSKALGIEMSALLDLTEQFDTFEGAAKAAGSLNAALGGPFLDAMKLHTAATKEDQIAMIQNAMQASGKSWDSLSRLEKKYIASAAGINDATVANNMFSESNRKSAAELRIQAINEEQAAKNRKKATNVTQMLTAAMQQLAIAAEPIAKIIHGIASAIAAFAQSGLGKFIGYIALGIIGFKLFAMTILGLKALFVSLSIGFGLWGTAAAATAPATVTAGLSLKAFAVAAIASAKPIGILGLAFLALGAGVALAGLGIWLVVSAFGSLLSTIIENREHMGSVLVLVLGLAGSIAVLGLGLVVAAAGFVALAVGIGIFLMSLPAIGGAGLVIAALALAVGGLGLAFLLAGGNIKSVADSITSMVNSIGEMKDSNGFTKFVNVVEKIDDANTDGLEKVVDQAERFVEVQAKMSNAAVATALTNVMDKVADWMSGEKEKGEPKREIILELDKVRFGKAVVDSFSEDMKMST